jgi:predicted signal transduction protein with EAL and GGDEF domain
MRRPRSLGDCRFQPYGAPAGATDRRDGRHGRTRIKRNQTFIRKLLDSKSDQAIVTSTIELAHNFGLSVVAEGIEDEDTAAWLKAHECDIGQGYCYARPMPAEELVAFAQARAMRVHEQAAGPLDSYT